MPTKQLFHKGSNNRIQLDKLYISVDPIDIKDKVVIDIEDVVDYCFCPYYYDTKMHYKNNYKNITNRNLYDKLLRKTFYSYLRAFSEGRLENTLEFLKYSWGKEWIKSKKVKDLIAIRSSYKNDTYENLRKKGIDSIFKFDELMSNDKQFPIVVNHKYEIEIIPNVILTGTYEYIRELTVNDQKIIQIVKFVTDYNRFNTNISKKFDLELIAMAYSFKETFNVSYFQVVTIDIYMKQIFINTYTEKEYDLLKRTVKDTVISIQNDLRCISPNKCCYHCEYRDICINKL